MWTLRRNNHMDVRFSKQDLHETVSEVDTRRYIAVQVYNNMRRLPFSADEYEDDAAEMYV